MKESKGRARAALCNPGFSYLEDKVTVDLDEIISECSRYPVDLSKVKGQETAKHAIEVAVAGGHNILKLWTQTDIPVRDGGDPPYPLKGNGIRY